MKIGIIFFGLPRNTQSTLPSIKKFIFDALAGHEIFIESCFSLQSYISNAHSNEATILDQSNYDFFKQYPHQFIQPEALLDKDLFEQVIQFGDKWKDNGRSLKNLLMQLNCIQIAYLRCKKHDCDFYIFVRPDMIIHEIIPIKAFIGGYANKKAVLLPSWQWHRGINDRFAITTRSAADIYGLRTQQTVNYCLDSKKPLHSEGFLQHLLSINNVKIRTFNTKMSRVRANGHISAEEFSPVKRMGGFRPACYAQLHQIYLKDSLLGLVKIVGYYFSKVTRQLEKRKNS